MKNTNKGFIHNVASKAFHGGLTMISRISPTAASKIRYRYYMHKKLNLKKPQTLNEKMMYLKLNKYWNRQFVADCADKYAVRKTIMECGCPELLIDLYGVWDRVEDIDWDSLPNKFVIKCNHGCGYNILCTDKSKFDIEHAKKLLRKWMKESYGFVTVEQGIYGKIKKKIIAEKFIETVDEKPLCDYKFFCSYGEVKFLYVVSDRENGETKLDYYEPDWKWIPVTSQYPNKGAIEKPLKLEEMKQYASILSKDFPLVRVDLYNEGEDIFFGELTFTPTGCLATYSPEKYATIFGKYFPDVEELEKYNSAK